MVLTRCITERFDFFGGEGGGRNSGIQKNTRVIKQFSDGVIKKFCGKIPLNWMAVPSKYHSLTF